MRSASAPIYAGDFAQLGEMTIGTDSAPAAGSWWSGSEDLHDEPVRVIHRKSLRGAMGVFSHDHWPLSFIQPLELMQLGDFETGTEPYCLDAKPSSSNGASSLFCLAAVGAIHALSPAPQLNLYYVPHAITRDAVRTSYLPTPRLIELIPTDSPIAGWQLVGDEILDSGLSFSVLEDRVRELRNIAAEEEIEISNKSLSDLEQLFALMPIGIPPLLFLLDNGNIRVSWRESINKHASFELMGDGEAKPVIFSQDPATEIRNQLYGAVSLARIPKLLEAAGLDEWIFAA
jgi:hypothetical protein